MDFDSSAGGQACRLDGRPSSISPIGFYGNLEIHGIPVASYHSYLMVFLDFRETKA